MMKIMVRSIFKFKTIFHKGRSRDYSLLKVNKESVLMKHTETKALYTVVYFSGNAKYFWGLNHHQKACGFFHSLPTNKVIRVK